VIKILTDIEKQKKIELRKEKKRLAGQIYYALNGERINEERKEKRRKARIAKIKEMFPKSDVRRRRITEWRNQMIERGL
jgi:hypothetical protein